MLVEVETDQTLRQGVVGDTLSSWAFSENAIVFKKTFLICCDIKALISSGFEVSATPNIYLEIYMIVFAKENNILIID